jgi:YggT family protein
VAPFTAGARRCQGSAAEKAVGRLVRAPATRYICVTFPEAIPTRTILPMRALLDVIMLALQLYIWLLIASAVLSWLIAFNVVNVRNQFVSTIGEFLYRITEPALRPIRNMLPNLGGLDISPVILILIIYFIENVIALYIYPNVF